MEALARGRVSSATAVNIASGEPHTVGELAAELARATGGAAPVVTGEYRLGDVRHVIADPGLAERLLGFRARTGFAEGVLGLASAPLRASTGRVPSPRP